MAESITLRYGSTSGDEVLRDIEVPFADQDVDIYLNAENEYGVLINVRTSHAVFMEVEVEVAEWDYPTVVLTGIGGSEAARTITTTNTSTQASFAISAPDPTAHPPTVALVTVTAGEVSRALRVGVLGTGAETAHTPPKPASMAGLHAGLAIAAVICLFVLVLTFAQPWGAEVPCLHRPDGAFVEVPVGTRGDVHICQKTQQALIPTPLMA